MTPFGLPVELVVGLGRVAREPDPARPQIVRDALRLARAGHLIERRFDTLSGGEQARVQLARVLAPSGSPHTARTCCSNWLVVNASIVRCPELCGRGAISFTSSRPSPSNGMS